VRNLAPWERERNAKILAALDKQRKEFESNPAKAREFFMKLGYWNEDGSLKDDLE
jgi:hypothetical protein